MIELRGLVNLEVRHSTLEGPGFAITPNIDRLVSGCTLGTRGCRDTGKR